MKLSKETLAILKNFAMINPSIRLSEGSFIMTKSINGVAYAEATVADVFDTELNIYDLPNFLSIVNQLGADADVSIVGDEMVIQSGRAKVMMTDADAAAIVVPRQRLRMPPTEVEFKLKSEDLAEILKVSRAVGGDQINFTHRDGRLVIDAFNVEDASDDTSIPRTRYTLDMGEYDGDVPFNFILSLGNINVVPGDYDVAISSMGAVKFEGLNSTYVFVMETRSNHGF